MRSNRLAEMQPGQFLSMRRTVLVPHGFLTLETLNNNVHSLLVTSVDARPNPLNLFIGGYKQRIPGEYILPIVSFTEKWVNIMDDEGMNPFWLAITAADLQSIHLNARSHIEAASPFMDIIGDYMSHVITLASKSVHVDSCFSANEY
jgi:hypothetical protein